MGLNLNLYIIKTLIQLYKEYKYCDGIKCVVVGWMDHFLLIVTNKKL